MHVQIGTFWPSAAAYRAAVHSQAPRAAAKQQQRQLEATCRFDTPLPIWCMRLCPGPSTSHERELKAQVSSDAHRNSHLNLDFRLGKVQLACAPSCARAPGSRCHRRAADSRCCSVCSTALQSTLQRPRQSRRRVEYGTTGQLTSRPFRLDAVRRFTPLSREARSTPPARLRSQRVLGRDAAGSSRRRVRNRANVGAVSSSLLIPL